MGTKILLPTIAAMGMALAACDVTDPIYNTANPDYGKITLTTDWSDRGADVAIPASYTVRVGAFSAVLSGTVNAIDNLFPPATYRALVCNTADHIAVSGTTASVEAASVAAPSALSLVDNAPGWFFSCAMDMPIEKDKTQNFTAIMRQQVRQLTLVIEPVGGTADRIESIAGTLSGVAGTLDIDTQTHGSPSNVALTFTKIVSGPDAGKWSATVRLLGVAGSRQQLGAVVAFTGNTPAPIDLDSDLTTALAGFNSDKKTPLTLGSQIVETGTATGFTATITGWNQVAGGQAIAN